MVGQQPGEAVARTFAVAGDQQPAPLAELALDIIAEGVEQANLGIGAFGCEVP